MGHTNSVDRLVEKKNGGSNMATKQQNSVSFLILTLNYELMVEVAKLLEL